MALLLERDLLDEVLQYTEGMSSVRLLSTCKYFAAAMLDEKGRMKLAHLAVNISFLRYVTWRPAIYVQLERCISLTLIGCLAPSHGEDILILNCPGLSRSARIEFVVDMTRLNMQDNPYPDSKLEIRLVGSWDICFYPFIYSKGKSKLYHKCFADVPTGYGCVLYNLTVGDIRRTLACDHKGTSHSLGSCDFNACRNRSSTKVCLRPMKTLAPNEFFDRMQLSTAEFSVAKTLFPFIKSSFDDYVYVKEGEGFPYSRRYELRHGAYMSPSLCFDKFRILIFPYGLHAFAETHTKYPAVGLHIVEVQTIAYLPPSRYHFFVNQRSLGFFDCPRDFGQHIYKFKAFGFMCIDPDFFFRDDDPRLTIVSVQQQPVSPREQNLSELRPSSSTPCFHECTRIMNGARKFIIDDNDDTILLNSSLRNDRVLSTL